MIRAASRKGARSTLRALASTTAILAALGTAALAADEGSGHSSEAAPLTLASDAFEEGKPIPAEFTCDGGDRSPALHWQGTPERTKAFALVVDDPDAPNGHWTHWLLYNVPAATQALTEGVATNGKLGDGSLQGTNDFGKTGYGGPCPPKGSSHRYVFTLYALSAPLEPEPGAKRPAVLDAIADKKVGEAKLTARYSRK